ncbi:MAG: aquaporin Z [Bacteroidota bacterium]
MKKLIAEFIGTLWLVLGGCGSAVMAAAFPELGIGFVGVSMAFGLTVLTMAYAIGHISGCHLNPAVTIGLAVGGRMDKRDVVPYIIAQVLGAIAGAAVLFLIVSGKENFAVGGFAANGFGKHSPGGYDMVSAFITEVVMTMFFLIIILGATHSKAPKYLAGVAIGLGLTLIHLISIPVTNTSVNPARSTSQALFADGSWAIPQLWLFWLAPILGAIIAGVLYKYLSPEN